MTMLRQTRLSLCNSTQSQQLLFKMEKEESSLSFGVSQIHNMHSKQLTHATVWTIYSVCKYDCLSAWRNVAERLSNSEVNNSKYVRPLFPSNVVSLLFSF